MTNHNPYIVGALAAPFIVAVGTAAVASSRWAARAVEEARGSMARSSSTAAR